VRSNTPHPSRISHFTPHIDIIGQVERFSTRHGRQRRENARTMKKTSVRKKVQAVPEEMRREYRFDYAKAKPNRFAARMGAGLS
jgi:hypothetical protein